MMNTYAVSRTHDSIQRQNEQKHLSGADIESAFGTERPFD